MSGRKLGLTEVETRRIRVTQKIIIYPLAVAGIVIWSSREIGRNGKRLGLRLRRSRLAA